MWIRVLEGGKGKAQRGGKGGERRAFLKRVKGGASPPSLLSLKSEEKKGGGRRGGIPQGGKKTIAFPGEEEERGWRLLRGGG